MKEDTLRRFAPIYKRMGRLQDPPGEAD